MFAPCTDCGNGGGGTYLSLLDDQTGDALEGATIKILKDGQLICEVSGNDFSSCDLKPGELYDIEIAKDGCEGDTIENYAMSSGTNTIRVDLKCDPVNSSTKDLCFEPGTGIGTVKYTEYDGIDVVVEEKSCGYESCRLPLTEGRSYFFQTTKDYVSSSAAIEYSELIGLASDECITLTGTDCEGENCNDYSTKGIVNILVVDDKGRALVNKSVELIQPESEAKIISKVTDEYGGAEFEQKIGTEFKIRIPASGNTGLYVGSVVYEFTKAAQLITVTLNTQAPTKIRVYEMASGGQKTVPGILITVFDLDWVEQGQHLTNANGEYTFGLEKGGKYVAKLDDGLYVGEGGEVTGGTDTSFEVKKLAEESFGTIAATVIFDTLDELNNYETISGAKLLLWEKNSAGSWEPSGKTREADIDGFAEFTDVLPGDYCMTATAINAIPLDKSKCSERAITVTAGEETQAAVKMKRLTVQLTITVYKNTGGGIDSKTGASSMALAPVQGVTVLTYDSSDTKRETPLYGSDKKTTDIKGQVTFKADRGRQIYLFSTFEDAAKKQWAGRSEGFDPAEAATEEGKAEKDFNIYPTDLATVDFVGYITDATKGCEDPASGMFAGKKYCVRMKLNLPDAAVAGDRWDSAKLEISDETGKGYIIFDPDDQAEWEITNDYKDMRVGGVSIEDLKVTLTVSGDYKDPTIPRYFTIPFKIIETAETTPHYYLSYSGEWQKAGLATQADPPAGGAPKEITFDIDSGIGPVVDNGLSFTTSLVDNAGTEFQIRKNDGYPIGSPVMIPGENFDLKISVENAGADFSGKLTVKEKNPTLASEDTLAKINVQTAMINKIQKADGSTIDLKLNSHFFIKKDPADAAADNSVEINPDRSPTGYRDVFKTGDLLEITVTYKPGRSFTADEFVILNDTGGIVQSIYLDVSENNDLSTFSVNGEGKVFDLAEEINVQALNTNGGVVSKEIDKILLSGTALETRECGYTAPIDITDAYDKDIKRGFDSATSTYTLLLNNTKDGGLNSPKCRLSKGALKATHDDKDFTPAEKEISVDSCAEMPDIKDVPAIRTKPQAECKINFEFAASDDPNAVDYASDLDCTDGAAKIVVGWNRDTTCSGASLGPLGIFDDSVEGAELKTCISSGECSASASMAAGKMGEFTFKYEKDQTPDEKVREFNYIKIKVPAESTNKKITLTYDVPLKIEVWPNYAAPPSGTPFDDVVKPIQKYGDTYDCKNNWCNVEQLLSQVISLEKGDGLEGTECEDSFIGSTGHGIVRFVYSGIITDGLRAKLEQIGGDSLGYAVGSIAADDLDGISSSKNNFILDSGNLPKPGVNDMTVVRGRFDSKLCYSFVSFKQTATDKLPTDVGSIQLYLPATSLKFSQYDTQIRQDLEDRIRGIIRTQWWGDADDETWESVSNGVAKATYTYEDSALVEGLPIIRLNANTKTVTFAGLTQKDLQDVMEEFRKAISGEGSKLTITKLADGSTVLTFGTKAIGTWLAPKPISGLDVNKLAAGMKKILNNNDAEFVPVDVLEQSTFAFSTYTYSHALPAGGSEDEKAITAFQQQYDKMLAPDTGIYWETADGRRRFAFGKDAATIDKLIETAGIAAETEVGKTPIVPTGYIVNETTKEAFGYVEKSVEDANNDIAAWLKSDTSFSVDYKLRDTDTTYIDSSTIGKEGVKASLKRTSDKTETKLYPGGHYLISYNKDEEGTGQTVYVKRLVGMEKTSGTKKVWVNTKTTHLFIPFADDADGVEGGGYGYKMYDLSKTGSEALSDLTREFLSATVSTGGAISGFAYNSKDSNGPGYDDHLFIAYAESADSGSWPYHADYTRFPNGYAYKTYSIKVDGSGVSLTEEKSGVIATGNYWIHGGAITTVPLNLDNNPETVEKVLMIFPLDADAQTADSYSYAVYDMVTSTIALGPADFMKNCMTMGGAVSAFAYASDTGTMIDDVLVFALSHDADAEPYRHGLISESFGSWGSKYNNGYASGTVKIKSDGSLDSSAPFDLSPTKPTTLKYVEGSWAISGGAMTLAPYSTTAAHTKDAIFAGYTLRDVDRDTDTKTDSSTHDVCNDGKTSCTAPYASDSYTYSVFSSKDPLVWDWKTVEGNLGGDPSHGNKVSGIRRGAVSAAAIDTNGNGSDEKLFVAYADDADAQDFETDKTVQGHDKRQLPNSYSFNIYNIAGTTISQAVSRKCLAGDSARGDYCKSGEGDFYIHGGSIAVIPMRLPAA